MFFSVLSNKVLNRHVMFWSTDFCSDPSSLDQNHSDWFRSIILCSDTEPYSLLWTIQHLKFYCNLTIYVLLWAIFCFAMIHCVVLIPYICSDPKLPLLVYTIHYAQCCCVVSYSSLSYYVTVSSGLLYPLVLLCLDPLCYNRFCMLYSLVVRYIVLWNILLYSIAFCVQFHPVLIVCLYSALLFCPLLSGTFLFCLRSVL